MLLVRQGVPVSLVKWTCPRPSISIASIVVTSAPAPSSVSLRRYGEGAANTPDVTRGIAIPSDRYPLVSLISSPFLPLALSFLSALRSSRVWPGRLHPMQYVSGMGFGWTLSRSLSIAYDLRNPDLRNPDCQCGNIPDHVNPWYEVPSKELTRAV